VGVPFYLISAGLYILLGDTIMALFLLIRILTLDRKERPLSIRTSHSIKINKNTAMIVPLGKICCPSDPDGLYILVGDTIMALFLLIRILCDVLIRQWTFFST
jgi:hypothetical protein